MATKPTMTIADAPFDDPADSVDLVIRTADPPFNDPTDSVDLVIRTVDNVDFFVLSGMLSLRSPSSFFRHFLKNNQNAEERDGLPVLQVEEDSDTFRTILLFSYTNTVPQTKSVEQIMAMEQVLDKYHMDHTLEQFNQTVIASPLIKEQALLFFAHAIFNGWRVLGEAAAKNTLAIPFDDPEEELTDLGYINALQYIRLRNYHRKCRRVAQDVFLLPHALPWLEGKASELRFLGHSSNKCRWCEKSLEGWFSGLGYTHTWIVDYLATVKAEVLRRPHPGIALDDTIIAQAVVKSISQCPHEEWKKIAVSQIRQCGTLLMKEIDRQISQVPLNIDWTRLQIGMNDRVSLNDWEKY